MLSHLAETLYDLKHREPASHQRLSLKELMSDSGDQSTYLGRVAHFMQVTSFLNFFVSTKSLNESVALVDKYKALQGDERDPSKVMLTINREDHKELKKAMMVRNSAYNGDSDELIPKPLRMCSFMPANIPILALVLLAPPTMFNTILAQWMNQSYKELSINKNLFW